MYLWKLLLINFLVQIKYALLNVSSKHSCGNYLLLLGITLQKIHKRKMKCTYLQTKKSWQWIKLVYFNTISM